MSLGDVTDHKDTERCLFSRWECACHDLVWQSENLAAQPLSPPPNHAKGYRYTLSHFIFRYSRVSRFTPAQIGVLQTYAEARSARAGCSAKRPQGEDAPTFSPYKFRGDLGK